MQFPKFTDIALLVFFFGNRIFDLVIGAEGSTAGKLQAGAI
ncbi:MAG: hypothetical protein ACREOI_18950 [bacterium]